MSVISKMTFDNGSTKNLIGSTFYGKCITAAATAAKTVTIGGWDESVKDNVSGATVHIYFTNGNSVSNPTLNIDSQGAHKIITSLDTSVGSFSAGIYSFTLIPSNVPGDNTYRWMMEANVDWSNVGNKPSLDFIPTSQKGAASGVATLDSNSKVPIVQSNYLYGKCSTVAGTAAKTVTIAGYSETTIAAMEGVTVFVAFAYSNTAANPTLNVSGSGAHPIVAGTYQDPANVGRFSNGLHSFTLVKASDNNYYWWINEGRDTVPEAPTSDGYYALRIQSGMNNIWSSFTIPSAPTTGTVTLNASGWSGNGPYSHAVTISGTTANSKIDLQPDSTVLAQMTTDGTTSIYIENNNGTLTAWAMGAAPTASLTIQYTKTEVA